MGDIAEAQVKQQDVDISYMHWIRGAFLGLVVSALPCTLAVYSVATNTSLEEHPHFLGFEVVGPAVVQAAIELGLASKMAPAIAFELVEERSERRIQSVSDPLLCRSHQRGRRPHPQGGRLHELLDVAVRD